MNRFLAVMCLAAALPTVGAIPAMSEEGVTGWAEEPYARVRLISAGQADDGTWRAGLEIDMEDGWKTYWRVPGETGVPPLFDWSGSQNVADVTVGWPTPVRFLDSGLESIGYKTDVVLPLSVTEVVPGTAPRLSMNLTYAVCAHICVPQFAELTLDMAQVAPFRIRLKVTDAEGSVPAAIAGDDAVVAAQGGASRDAPLVLRIAHRDGNPPADVFVTGPQDWYLPKPEMAESGGDAMDVTVPLSGVPKSAEIAGTPLSVTVVYPSGAVEQAVTIPR